MKSIYKILFFVTALAIAGILTNCSDDPEGTPSISYIRITDPEKSDSLLITAGQGQMVAIMGNNLGSTKQVWFNDQKAVLNATFITDNTIILRVPSQIPETISNKLKLYFANGDSLLYDFAVDISKPVITRMQSDYVNTGDNAVFYGDYFYEPLVVTFTGGAVGEIVSVEDQILKVKVPDGAQPGPITITNNFGETETDSWFRDNRNIIATFEGPFVNGWWRGGDFVVTSDPAIPNVNGKFMRVNKGPLGAWPYLEVYGGPADGDVALTTKVIPQEAFAKPSDYSLKFELNTQASIAGANMRLYLGSAPGGSFGDARNNIYYVWQANVDTHGQWETITIPWADVYAANGAFAYNASGYGLYIYFHGPNAANYNFGLDNMRVVPNTND